VWSFATHGGEQFAYAGRSVLVRSDAEEHLAQPDEHERVYKHQQEDDDDADGDDGDVGCRRQDTASTIVGWTATLVTDADVLRGVTVTEPIHLAAL